MTHEEARARLTELGIFRLSKQVSLLHRATVQSVINTVNRAGVPVYISYDHVTGYDAGYGALIDGRHYRYVPPPA